MKTPIQEYKTDEIIVRFDPRICIHSGVCVMGLRAVFDVEKRPWVNVEGASAEASTVKCDACGMMMSTTAKAGQRAVKIGGKTYYCCKGCDMSKQVDK